MLALFCSFFSPFVLFSTLLGRSKLGSTSSNLQLATFYSFLFFSIGLSSSETSDIWKVLYSVDNESVLLTDFKILRWFFAHILHGNFSIPSVLYVFFVQFCGVYFFIKMTGFLIGSRILHSVLPILIIPLSFGASFESHASLLVLFCSFLDRSRCNCALFLLAIALHLAALPFVLLYYFFFHNSSFKFASIIALICIVSLAVSGFFELSQIYFIQYMVTKLLNYTGGVWAKFVGPVEYLVGIVNFGKVTLLAYYLYRCRGLLSRSRLWFLATLTLILFLACFFRTFSYRFAETLPFLIMLLICWWGPGLKYRALVFVMIFLSAAKFNNLQYMNGLDRDAVVRVLAPVPALLVFEVEPKRPSVDLNKWVLLGK